jgi:glycosyltransferase involved in cell wall biosynthesis
MTKRVCLSIIVPAFNEEKRLPSTLKAIINYLTKQKYSSEIIIVSDGSIDKTKKVSESFKETFSELKVIEYFPNRGKGAAVKEGIEVSRGDYKLFMDADMAVPVEFISKFLKIIVNGYDIVIGSRGMSDSKIQNHQSFSREFLAKVFGFIQQFILVLTIKDTQCGFKLFTKNATDTLFPQVLFDCAYFDAELLFLAQKMGLSIAEVGVSWSHDGETRLPIGVKRSIEIIKKLLLIQYYH